MSRILIYTFFVPSNTSSQVLKQLKGVDKYYLGSLKQLEKKAAQAYDYILGLGDYSSLAKNLREPTFINRYGKNKIAESAPNEFDSQWLITGKLIVPGSKPTNGPCNRSAFLVSQYLASIHSQTKVAFLHLPHKGNQVEFLAAIQAALANYL